MNEAARQTLCELVATYGHDLARDARRCEGLLRDFCAQERREIFVLTSAVRAGVAADVSTPPAAMPLRGHLTQLARRLEDHLALTPDAAAWAVESWAIALGVLTADETIQLRGAQPANSASDSEQEVRGGAGHVLACMAGVALLWALVGGSAASFAAAFAGLSGTSQAANWIAAGALGGAALGALAGALIRTIGGVVSDLAGWAVGGTVGGAALGALAGAAAGAVSGVATQGPATAVARALQWATVGATVGGLATTVLGLVGRGELYRNGRAETITSADVAPATAGGENG
jgi:hypothetical protein